MPYRYNGIIPELVWQRGNVMTECDHLALEVFHSVSFLMLCRCYNILNNSFYFADQVKHALAVASSLAEVVPSKSS